MNIFRLLFGILLLSAIPPKSFCADLPADPNKNPQMQTLTNAAHHLIQEKKFSAAIEKCDAVISAFKSYYGNQKVKVYSGRTSVEHLANLLTAAKANNQRAISISPVWPEAYFLKGYALQDLGRIPEAKEAIKLAAEMSPFNAHYRSELGEIYLREKDWPKAQKAFEIAEDDAQLAPDNSKFKELGVARRGLAYVFVELGELQKAEDKYLECLKADPNDKRAAQELKYVRGLQAKAKSK